jgi:hypothetical protein
MFLKRDEKYAESEGPAMTFFLLVLQKNNDAFCTSFMNQQRILSILSICAVVIC